MSEQKQRYRVTIRCQECGEKFVLRGRQNNQGNYETGFKSCVCGNEENLEIDATHES